VNPRRASVYLKLSGRPLTHDLFRTSTRRPLRAALAAPLLALLGLGLGLALAPSVAGAAINLVAPSRVIDPSQPFRLTLMVTGETESQSFSLPEVLRVSLSPDLGAASRVELRRETPIPDQLDLRLGEFRRIDYVGELPAGLRGRMRIDAIDLDAPAMLVQISTPNAATVAAQAAAPNVVAAGAPAAEGAPAVTTLSVRADADPNRQDQGRMSFYEPMFAVIGPGIEANAQFQFSFKLRLYEPADKNSRRIQDNLYFGYTQASFWDLTSDSKPFLDTSYMPGFFYQAPSTDWRVAGNEVGFAAGYEHESNGKDGDASRSIDILYVRPKFEFGDSRDFHWTFEPKVYVYAEKSENADMPSYRGYGDYRLSYGKNDDWQVAANLRKGTKASAFSADVQGTYPLSRLRAGLSGYLMAQYFTGYGETLLNYNQREPWSLRFGYAIWR
jgi:outer membrane phospholipase A